MKLLDFLARECGCVSNSMSRRVICQGAVKVNGSIVFLEDEIELEGGDLVEVGQKIKIKVPMVDLFA